MKADLQSEQVENYDLDLSGQAIFFPELAEVLDELNVHRSHGYEQVLVAVASARKVSLTWTVKTPQMNA